MTEKIDLRVQYLAQGYESGRLRPAQVLEQVYENIERMGAEPVWIALRSFEESLEALHEAAERGPHGPLFGIPFAVKDNIDVAGLPTTAACPLFAYTPTVNACVVQRLVQAGAIVIGKTNLDQFATGLTGTRSPYGVCASVFDPNYISGGSSSGSAIAVARGDVSFSLGTDTAGSGRIPAAFNALVGLKPTRGLISTRGVVPACRTLDCVSIFAHTIGDVERVLESCAGFDVDDPYAREAAVAEITVHEPPRFGVPQASQLEFFGDGESEALYAQFVARLERRGWKKSIIDYAPFRRAAELLYQGPWVAERFASIGEFMTRSPEAMHPIVRSVVAGARTYSASDAFGAIYELAALKRSIEPLWASIDTLLLPTAPTHYRIDEVLADPIRLNQNLGTYTNFANLLDLCALATPAGFKRNGLPFGVTWFAPAFHDQSLREIARQAAGENTPQSNLPPKGRVWLAVAGAHLSGQPLNNELLSRRARLVKTTTTSPQYRLFALGTTPPKPGLVHTREAVGRCIEVEVWEMDDAAFGNFVSQLPAPMTIGTTLLADGSAVKGFTCEPFALEGAREITHFGGWRPYLASSRRA